MIKFLKSENCDGFDPKKKRKKFAKFEKIPPECSRSQLPRRACFSEVATARLLLARRHGSRYPNNIRLIELASGAHATRLETCNVAEQGTSPRHILEECITFGLQLAREFSSTSA